MHALRTGGRDRFVAGELQGIRAKVGDVEVFTTDAERLVVKLAPTGEVAFIEMADGMVILHPGPLDKVLDLLRKHQVLDDLASE